MGDVPCTRKLAQNIGSSKSIDGDLTMAAKFIQFFDILSGKEEEFIHFASKNYIPGIHEMGLTRIIGSWHFGYRKHP